MNMKNNIHPIPGSPLPSSLQGGKGETIPALRNERGLMARLKGASCLFALLPLSLSLASCIDEDLSRCGVNYSVDYVVHQQTDLQAEVAAVLSSPQEQEAAEAVETALGGVFTNLAHDLDLSFYANHAQAYHERNIIDASSASFTFYLQQTALRPSRSPETNSNSVCWVRLTLSPAPTLCSTAPWAWCWPSLRASK